VNESQVFGQALQCTSPTKRDAYLDTACVGNPRLRADVGSLLRAHDSDPGFLAEGKAVLRAPVSEGKAAP
jgi:hypothetical protein